MGDRQELDAPVGRTRVDVDVVADRATFRMTNCSFGVATVAPYRITGVLARRAKNPAGNRVQV